MKKEKDRTQQLYNTDKSVHRTFQIGGLFLLGFIVYSLYFDTDNAPKNRANSLGNLTQEELNVRVKQAFEKMAASPQYKDIKDFVMYMETNTDGKTPKILNGNDGIIIYLPNEIVSKQKNSVRLEDKDLKISIESEKKSQVVPQTESGSPLQENSGAEKPQ